MISHLNPYIMPHTAKSRANYQCRLKVKRGPCKAILRRWAYEPAKGACLEFSYGGCRGNANNFATAADCSRVCGATPTPGYVR